MLQSVKMKVQLGGGVRDMRTVDGWLEKGVARVIIGTAAVKDPGFVREAARLPSRPRRGRHRRARRPRRGRRLGATVRHVCARPRPRFEDAGVAAIIYTDICARRRAAGPQHRGDRRARRGA